MLKAGMHIAVVFWRMSVFALCGFISAYVLASGYESIYNQPLPFVSTISAVNLSAFNSVYHLNSAAATPKTTYYGNFGKPVTLKLPASSLRLNIVSSIKDGNSWLARPSTLQLLIPSPPRSGNIGVVFLYCRSGFRTINANNMPAPGQNIFMDTDQSWRYVYKVTAAHAYSGTDTYVPSDDGTTGKLIIDCYDQAAQTNVIAEANLLSVQGVQQ